MMWRGLIVGTALIGSTPAWTQTTTTKLDTVSGIPDVDKATQTQDVQFKTEPDDRMTVPVKLSGNGPYRFLVDTGADRTAVSRQIVAALKLPSAGEAELHSVAGATSVGTAKVGELEFTRPPELSIEAAVLDRANMGADGIVGVDVLRSQRVQFDFEKQVMSIVPSDTPDFDLRAWKYRGARQAQERSPDRDRCRRERREFDGGPRYRVTGQHRQPGSAPSVVGG